jgi:hypothetical protein
VISNKETGDGAAGSYFSLLFQGIHNPRPSVLFPFVPGLIINIDAEAPLVVERGSPGVSSDTI